MNTNAISLVPVKSGWAVMLSDGRELARFTGGGAKQQAYRFLATANPLRPPPRLETVDEMAEELGGWRAGPDSFGPDEDHSSSPRRS
jgi:hypothetical protein